MSRNLFAFLLSELKTVRIICPHCGAAAEMTVEQLAVRFEGDRSCVGCGKFYGIEVVNGNPLYRLASALRDYQITRANAKFPDLEFVLPASEK